MKNPIQNFEAIEELFYWDLTFHLLGILTPKYLRFVIDPVNPQGLVQVNLKPSSE